VKYKPVPISLTGKLLCLIGRHKWVMSTLYIPSLQIKETGWICGRCGKTEKIHTLEDLREVEK